MSSLPTTMHRVLAIPELLDTVFKSMDSRSNLNNALVSRAWSEIALDTLWRQVNDLYRLFNLLAPLRIEPISGKYEFSHPPESSDWTRFHRYSKRVRELVYNEHKSKRKLNQSVFDDVARTRISISILPNMHTLGWSASISLCVMFLNSNIKNFTVHIPSSIDVASSRPLLRPFFDDITARMPDLMSLNIQTNIPMNALELDVVRLLESLPNLHKLILPRFCFTTSIAECVSRLSKLGCIEYHYSEEQGNGEADDIKLFKPELSEGAFPSLWDLSLATTYDDLQRFLTIPFSPSSITMLHVESPNIETPGAIHQLLVAISENCQMLKFLALISRRQSFEVDLSEDQINTTRRVSMDTLKPILACANLTSFEIIHQYPLLLQQEDVETFATRWPSLETLNLNSEPYDLRWPKLTLEALLPFARHCHRLSDLSIFLDASTNLIPKSSSSSPLPMFLSLNRVSMGLSKITASAPVAIFLSHLLPITCTIDNGVTWLESFEYGPADELVLHEELTALWASVDDLVPTLISVRLEERERVRWEVEDLGSELKVLRSALKTLSDKVDYLEGESSSIKDVP
ncbi:hypothetical protein AGABI2DRAFT_210964 [Agaricus bisporus var. bisporus H97]|uniref:hypothetical protein n=1 Tax=Agaricus bisporus var. bisporus (strain H97 / ATCC MYA-4626 / FGSC 10389) TaxID=936046 RepID=UPI00029F62A3|nr:hypothetical protein AGABI2DRAFT_210964 [Agaricus bisporus var. bisporus H97]EKV43164.1 hypothetical protein AGABI2DRAFT_210964 [Agaricus bisporus var. bisporus H97]